SDTLLRRKAARAYRLNNVFARPCLLGGATNAAHRLLQIDARHLGVSELLPAPAWCETATKRPATDRGSQWHRPTGRNRSWQISAMPASGRLTTHWLKY